jgi:hypothetical protein
VPKKCSLYECRRFPGNPSLMSPTVHFIYYTLWAIHPVLHGVVGTVMWRHKLRAKFPVFFAYLVTQVVIFAILFPIRFSEAYAAFFYIYWVTAALSAALGFKVIHEVFLDVFRPYHTLKDLGTILFQWAGLVMVLVAGVVAAASSTSEQGPLVQAVLTVQRSVRVIQCGLVLFLILFSRYLGVSRRQHSFGIAVGFGGFACVELIALAFRASGYVGYLSVDLVNMSAYNLAILCWLYFMWHKSEMRDAATMLASQRWDQSLTEIQYPVPADSLIPMFENMVDRALSRSGQEAPEEPQAPAEKQTPAEAGSFLSQMMSGSDPDSDLVISTALPRRPPEPR